MSERLFVDSIEALTRSGDAESEAQRSFKRDYGLFEQHLYTAALKGTYPGIEIETGLVVVNVTSSELRRNFKFFPINRVLKLLGDNDEERRYKVGVLIGTKLWITHESERGPEFSLRIKDDEILLGVENAIKEGTRTVYSLYCSLLGRNQQRRLFAAVEFMSWMRDLVEKKGIRLSSPSNVS